MDVHFLRKFCDAPRTFWLRRESVVRVIYKVVDLREKVLKDLKFVK